jgi:hypothetical protein
LPKPAPMSGNGASSISTRAPDKRAEENPSALTGQRPAVKSPRSPAILSRSGDTRNTRSLNTCVPRHLLRKVSRNGSGFVRQPTFPCAGDPQKTWPRS